MLRVPVDRLVYVSAEHNYSHVHTQDGHSEIVSYQLGQVEDIIGTQLGSDGQRFVRLGRGLIVNIDFVYFIDITKQRLVLSDCAGCYYDIQAPRDVLIQLKALIDDSFAQNNGTKKS